MPNLQHGTYSTYVNHKCRCDSCREARRLYMSQYRAKKRAFKGFLLSVPESQNGESTDVLARCRKCGNWYCLRDYGSFQCRECGYYDGDSTYTDYILIEDLVGISNV